jgi:hypothetical protein
MLSSPPSAPPRGDLVLTCSQADILGGRVPPEVSGFFVGGRHRIATCTGVCWFGGDRLAVIHLAGRNLRIYRFHPGAGSREGGATTGLELLHEITEGLCFPEDVAVSPDGSLLAVTHSMSADLGVTLYRLDPHSSAPDPRFEVLRHCQPGWAFHGVRFSPDSRHLAFTEIGPTGAIEVVRVGTSDPPRTCFIENRHFPMKPKSLAFSQDGRLVAVSWGLNGGKDPAWATTSGMLSVHAYDSDTGVIAPVSLAEIRGPNEAVGALEMCSFLAPSAGGRYRILAAHQVADTITSFEFDLERASLSFTGVFADGVSFPHGLDASADGAFVAVTSYGEDLLRIDRVRPSSPRPSSPR